MTKAKKNTKQQNLDFASKSSNVVQLPITPMTKPAKVVPLPLAGYEKLAREVREREAKIDALDKDQREATATLIQVAKKARRAAEVEGCFHKTVQVAVEGEPGQPVQVIFKNTYSDLGVEHETVLKEALGAQYAGLFRREARVALKDDVTLYKLKAALGDRYEAFCDLFKVTEVLAPRGPFMEIRAERRRELSEILNTTLDIIVDTVQAKPAVKIK